MLFFFNFLDSLSKPNSTYMNIYVKSHNIVGYSFIEWIGGEKSPLICSIFKPHLQADPKVYNYKSRSGIGVMYGTYIFRIWKKNLRSISYFFFIRHLISIKSYIHLHEIKKYFKKCTNQIKYTMFYSIFSVDSKSANRFWISAIVFILLDNKVKYHSHVQFVVSLFSILGVSVVY